ncbi:MAG: J domain-containing protein [Bacteroidia bacterium]|nr:J domain-containing protein [Bacteroidia bacterium]
MKDHYNTLGLTPAATQQEIKQAFRRLAVRYHPDSNPDPQAHRIFLEINEAYQVLSDPDQRKIYDLSLLMVSYRTTPDPAWEPPATPPRPGPPRPDPFQNWAPWVRMLAMLTLLLAGSVWVDYLVADDHPQSEILRINIVPGTLLNLRLIVETGTDVFVADMDKADWLRRREMIIVRRTPWYGIVTRITRQLPDDGSPASFRPHYGIYDAFCFAPILMVIAALLSLLYRKHAERSTLLGLMAICMAPITWYFITVS